MKNEEFMLTQRLIRELLSPQKPASLFLLLTNRCNAKCVFCFNSQVGNARKDDLLELTVEEYREIAKANSPLLQTALGGGEPFLRSDLVEIVRAFYEHGQVRLFSIPTNGSQTRLILEMVEAIAGLSKGATINLMVSIDALGEKHDQLRGIPGLFDKAIDLCHDLLKLGQQRRNLNVVVNTTITEHNLNDVAELCDFLARELSGRPIYHNVVYDQRIGSSLFQDPSLLKKVYELELNDVIRQVRRRDRIRNLLVERFYIDLINAVLLRQQLMGKMLYRCTAGAKFFVLSPDGTVSPCEPFLFEKRYEEFQHPNLRDFDFRYDSVRHDPRYRQMLEVIERGGCDACLWSCATISSLMYDPRNWSLPLTTPKAAELLRRHLVSRPGPS